MLIVKCLFDDENASKVWEHDMEWGHEKYISLQLQQPIHIPHPTLPPHPHPHAHAFGSPTEHKTQYVDL
jgi:hypothetical protein